MHSRPPLVAALTAAFTTFVAWPTAQAAPQEAAPVAAPNAGDGGAALATELFNAGRALLELGRHAEACPKLAESARLDPRVGTLGNLADCEEKLGHLARARGYWQQAANLARSNGDDRVAQADAQLARLDAVVPRLRVSARGAVPTGMIVRVDTVEVGIASLGTPMPLDPGLHAVEVSAPGRVAWKADVLLPSTGERVELLVPDLPVAPSPTPPAPRASSPPPEGASSSPTPLAVVGLGAAGAGVLGLGAGVYFAGVAQSRTDLSNELGCDGDRCTSRAAEVREAARDAGTAATVLLIAGGAMTAGGLVTFLLAPEEGGPGPSAQVPRGARARVDAAVAPDPRAPGGVAGLATVRGVF